MAITQADRDLEATVHLLKDVPHAYLYMLRRILTSNDSTDWTKGVIRPAFTTIWPMFLVLHAIVGIIGFALTILMAVDICHKRFYRTNTGKYLLNIAANHVLITAVEMPMNFLIMLYENWVFGKAMCYVASVVPYMLVHCTMITFIIMTVDRYRSIAHPEKRQVNSILCLFIIWISSTCAAMPVVTYIFYRDIGHLDPKVKNNGLCWSTGDDYSRIVFVTIFTLPVVLIALLVIKITAELKTKEALYHVHELHTRQLSPDADDVDINSLMGEDSRQQHKDKRWLMREKRFQRYLTTMIGLWVLCWFPIKVFGIINTNTIETDENMNLLDLAHMILLPISAMCTITTPICYKLMTRSTKANLIDVNGDGYRLASSPSSNCDSVSNKSIGYTSTAGTGVED